MTLRNPVNKGYNYNWDLGGATIVEESADHSCVKISYEKEGKKDISLTVSDADGNESVVKKTLSVLPGLSFNDPLNVSEIRGSIDIDCDGTPELLYVWDYHYQYLKSYLLKYNGSGEYEQIKKLWNTNIENADTKSADVNNDGLPDIIFSAKPAILTNEGDLDMTYESVKNTCWQYSHLVDLNNDGYLDVLFPDTQSPLRIWPNKGDYINYGEIIDFRYLFNSNSYTEDILLKDFDGNGYTDIAFIQLSGFFFKPEYGIVYNHGDFNFTLDMFSPRTEGSNIIGFFDADSDSKIDLLVQYKKDGQYYFKIEWGNGSETELPDLYEIAKRSTTYDIDIDNNGYNDIIVSAKGKNDTDFSTYVIMTYKSYTADVIKLGPSGVNDEIFYDGENRPRVSYGEGLLTGHNEKPKAPTGIRCAQSSKGVLIEWNHSADRESPAQAMRYNLSVKHKGADGEGAYLISPMNCGKNGVHVPWDITLITSNRYFIPIDKIAPGEYEVMVQGVDLWRMESDFSAVYNLTVTESVDIDMPASTYTGQETKVTVGANVTAQIDWNGAEVTNDGKEYIVKWTTPGTKTITVGKKKYEILVKETPVIKCEMPSVVQAQAKVVVKGENLSSVKITTYPDYVSPSKLGEDIALIFNKAGEYVVKMQTEIDGLLIEKEYNVTATEPSAPEIAMVGIDAIKGKYCINMADVEVPLDATALNVYKETQSQGEYRLVATLAPTTTKFVDEESHPTISAEKYKLTWQMNYGESLSSVEHKPLHVMINKGVGNAWNLIWNKYEGLDVATYRILRGSRVDNLKAIAEVSGSMASFCDADAPAGELYYAIEVLNASAPQRVQSRAESGYAASRSNVISTKDAYEVVFVESIDLKSTTGSNKIDASINPDLQLIASLAPSTVTYRQLNWTVIDGQDIVSVDQKGLVTAKQNGEATIRAYALDGSEIYADIDIEVFGVPIIITSLTLDKTELILTEGSSDFLHGIILPEDASNQDLEWSSSDETVAIAYPDGEIVALSTGQAIITATTQDGSDLTAQCVVNVTPMIIYAEKIVFETSEIALEIGKEKTLKCTVYPDDTTDKTLTWSSSDESVASVDSNGLVKAVGVGDAVITVKCGEVSATCKVKVTPIEVEGVTLSHSSVNLLIGDKLTVSATIVPDNATDQSLEWTVTDPSIATIKVNGSTCEIIGVGVGTTKLTVKASNGINATMTITVNPIKAESVTLDQKSVTLTIGDTYQLEAKINPDNATDKTLTWSSSDESVATVDSNGLVKAVGVGEAVITVKCGEVSATCKVKVTPIEVEGVKLSQSSVNLLIGDKLTVSATIVPNNATDQSLEWTVADPDIATIKVNGSTCEITGVGVGTTKLTVKASNGISATMTITVDPIKAESVTLDQKSMTLTIGDTYQLEAKITPDNTTDKTLTWSSSDESVATVDSNGLVKAVGVGEAVITVKCGDVSVTCKVKVTPVLAESIKLDTQKLTLKEGETYQFGYTIWPENTTFTDVEWRSSDISVVEVSQTGLVTVKHEGEAIVTVMVLDGSGVSDNCIINAESGINDITADTRNIHVEGNTIYNDYGYIVIYTAQGALIYAGDKDQITLEIAGVYLISTADFKTKILIR